MDILKGSTDQTLFIELVDSSTGLAKTGIIFTDVTGSYARTRSARVAITMATLASASAAHSDGGFILVDDTNQPGVYRIDVPDAAFATGAREVIITLKATGCKTVSRSISLVNIDNQVAPNNLSTTDVNGVLEAYRSYGVAAYEDTEIIKADTTQINAVVDEILLDTQEIANIPSGWTDEEREQIRYRLGLNGTATAPTDPTPDPIVVTPGTGNSTTGYYTVLDSNLDPEPGVTVYAKMLDAYDTDTGFIYSGDVMSSVSDAYGVCEFTMIKGASYRCWRTSPTPTAPISLIVVPLDAETTTPLKSMVRI